jgi:hypothetical protein
LSRTRHRCRCTGQPVEPVVVKRLLLAAVDHIGQRRDISNLLTPT